MASAENKAWLDFSAHVTKMERDGAFAEQFGAFVYSLKERQARELRRIIWAKRSTQQPAYVDILSRPDLVDAQDIKFLTESLTAREYWLLMKGLTLKSSRDWLQKGGRWKEQLDSPAPDPQLFSTLLARVPSADPDDEYAHTAAMMDAFQGAGLFMLTGAVLGDQGGALYSRLESNISQPSVQLVRQQIESRLVNDVPLAIDAKEGEAHTLWFKHYPGNDDPMVTNWLRSFERFKSLPDAGAELDLGRIRSRLESYLEALPKERKAYHVPCLRRMLADQVKQAGELMITALSQKSSAALQCFGNPKIKAEMAFMPQQISALVTSIQMSAMDSDLSKRLLGQLFITILNGKSPKMDDASVSKVLHQLRNDIDWAFCVGMLNAKGRGFLINNFGESSYFVEHLNVRDRGKKFTLDLGV